MTWQERLKSGLLRLEFPVDEVQRDALQAYLEMLIRWNKAYNLTAVRDPFEMVTLHLLDSAVISPHLQGENFADLGTGAGLPGIPLAVLNPDKRFTLVDSNGKKTRFVQQAALELGLKNINVVRSRIEDYRPDAPFDGILSRAFASLSDMLNGARHCIGPGSNILAMKGRYPEAELAELPAGFELKCAIPLSVPGLDSERHLIHIEPAGH